MTTVPAGPPFTIEEMLKELAPFGITLRPGTTVRAVLGHLRDIARVRGDPRSAIEKGGYPRLLMAIGDILYKKPIKCGRHSSYLGPGSWAVCHLDAKCIESPEDYGDIASRVACLSCRDGSLSSRDLVLDEMANNLDFEDGKTWLDLMWRGRTERLEFRVRDNWVDGRVCSDRTY